MQSLDVVVIGGGNLGLWTAYHLARRGAGSIAVCERHWCGFGATTRSAGMMRQQGGTETAIKLGKWSRDLYLQLGAELGLDSGFVQTGYYVLATRPRERDAFKDLVALRRCERLREVSRHGHRAARVALSGADAARRDRGGTGCQRGRTARRPGARGHARRGGAGLGDAPPHRRLCHHRGTNAARLPDGRGAEPGLLRATRGAGRAAGPEQRRRAGRSQRAVSDGVRLAGIRGRAPALGAPLPGPAGTAHGPRLDRRGGLYARPPADHRPAAAGLLRPGRRRARYDVGAGPRPEDGRADAGRQCRRSARWRGAPGPLRRGPDGARPHRAAVPDIMTTKGRRMDRSTSRLAGRVALVTGGGRGKI